LKPNPAEIRPQLERYLEFLKQDPKNPRIVAQVADLYLQLGEFSEARQCLETALTEDPNDAVLRFRLASVAIASGQPAQAIALLTALRAEMPDNAVMGYNLGYALMSAQRYAEACDILKAIPANTADAPATPLLLARCLHQLGEMDAAMAQTQLFLNTHPDSIEALGVLALLQLDTGNTAGAKETAEQALSKDPDNLEALVTSGSVALEKRDRAQAEDHFGRAIVHHPTCGRAWSGLGLSSMLDLDLTKATNDLRTAVLHMPDHIGTWHALAWCQLLTNNVIDAKHSFHKAMEIDQNDGETQGGLAMVAVLEGRRNDAEKLIVRALLLNPKSYAGRYAQRLLDEKTRTPDAIQELLKQMYREQTGPEGEALGDVIQAILKQKQGKAFQ